MKRLIIGLTLACLFSLLYPHLQYLYYLHLAQSPIQNSKKFVSLPVSNIDRKSIVIFAPATCPRYASKQADALAYALAYKGIPFSRSSLVNFNISDSDNSSIINSINDIMEGDSPIVFVKGKAKSNPTLDEVINEFNN